jgi:hypothetical protein
MDWLGLIDLYHELVSIYAISFIVNSYLVSLIDIQTSNTIRTYNRRDIRWRPISKPIDGADLSRADLNLPWLVTTHDRSRDRTTLVVAGTVGTIYVSDLQAKVNETQIGLRAESRLRSNYWIRWG